MRWISVRSATWLSRTPLRRGPHRASRAMRDELHARAAERLAALLLGGVDRLPALEGHVVRGALVEQLHDRHPVGGRGLRKPPPGRVLDELVDGLLRVLLVGPDDAGGPALDPADGVLAGDLVSALGTRDAATLVWDHAAAVVEGDALEPDALVADRRGRRRRTRSSRARRCRAGGSRRTRHDAARCGRRRSARPCRRPGARPGSGGSAARSSAACPPARAARSR